VNNLLLKVEQVHLAHQRTLERTLFEVIQLTPRYSAKSTKSEWFYLINVATVAYDDVTL